MAEIRAGPGVNDKTIRFVSSRYHRLFTLLIIFSGVHELPAVGSKTKLVSWPLAAGFVLAQG